MRISRRPSVASWRVQPAGRARLLPVHGQRARFQISDRRRKLLDLYYSGKIDAELFSDEEERLAKEIRALRDEDERAREEAARRAEVSRRLDDVLAVLRELNVDEIWAEATDQERRVLVEELLDVLAIFPDHLEVTVKGAPRLNVTLDEVGLKGGWWQFVGVGGGS
jgi:hypothetical protein